MHSNLGICIVCGYTTNVHTQHVNGGTHNCPNGHGNLHEVASKYAKVFIKSGMSNPEKLKSFKKIFPVSYNAGIRMKQIEKGERITEKQGSITKRYGQIKIEKIIAPFNDEDMELMQVYQSNPFVHPYTCNCGNVFIIWKWGLHCEKCGYLQTWVLKSSVDMMKNILDIKIN